MTLVTLHGAHLRSRSQEQPDHHGQGGVAVYPSPERAALQETVPLSSAPTEKALWRNTLIARRAALAVDDAAEASRQAARRFVREIELSSTSTVALFWSLEGEIDTKPLLHALHALGVPTALSRMQGRDRPLRFFRWAPGDPLDAGPYQVQQPLQDAPEVVPEIVLTPLLAFDAEGYRLGWGGGFYDRTIEQLRADSRPLLCVGYAFACQEVDHVPRESFDQRLDMVVTEHKVVPTR